MAKIKNLLLEKGRDDKNRFLKCHPNEFVGETHCDNPEVKNNENERNSVKIVLCNYNVNTLKYTMLPKSIHSPIVNISGNRVVLVNVLFSK